MEGASERSSMIGRLWTWIKLYRAWIAVAFTFTLIGIGLSAAYATAIDYTSHLDFCAHTCHEMESTVYQEYMHSKHYKNEQGVVVACAQCHVPQNNWPLTFGHKVLATFELWDHFVGQEYKLENFNKRRPALAEKVLAGFKETNARECKACHKYPNMLLEDQRPSIRAQHTDAMKIDENCLDCHSGGITHDITKEHPPATTPAAQASFDLN
jgi:nitrate/TMAO reductase-like tetraheme cytochrome c subunit